MAIGVVDSCPGYKSPAHAQYNMRCGQCLVVLTPIQDFRDDATQQVSSRYLAPILVSKNVIQALPGGQTLTWNRGCQDIFTVQIIPDALGRPAYCCLMDRTHTSLTPDLEIQGSPRCGFCNNELSLRPSQTFSLQCFSLTPHVIGRHRSREA